MCEYIYLAWAIALGEPRAIVIMQATMCWYYRGAESPYTYRLHRCLFHFLHTNKHAKHGRPCTRMLTLLLLMLAPPTCAGVEPALDWGGVTTSCFGGGAAGAAAVLLLVEEAGAVTEMLSSAA